MNKVRVLAGTRKGAFVLTADAARENWDVKGPFLAGWEIYHLKGSPVNPDRLYASQTSGWFGQVIQRSNDGGQTWEPVGNKFVYDGDPGTHQYYDGSQRPWEFKRAWKLEPSLTESETVYAGVEDAALFRSTDGGQNWQELPGLRDVKGTPVGAGKRVGCACTPSSRTLPTQNASSPPYQLPGLSAPMTVASPGMPSTEACSLAQSCLIPPPRSVTACTASPCTPHTQVCSSCRSIGT